jgi:hypothetical protein
MADSLRAEDRYPAATEGHIELIEWVCEEVRERADWKRTRAYPKEQYPRTLINAVRGVWWGEASRRAELLPNCLGTFRKGLLQILSDELTVETLTRIETLLTPMVTELRTAWEQDKVEQWRLEHGVESVVDEPISAVTTDAGTATRRKRKVDVVIADAEAHLLRNPWPGVNAFARLLKCSPATFSKACRKSPMLAKAKAEHEVQTKSVNAGQIQLMEDIGSDGPDPAEHDIDDLTTWLVSECQTEAERARVLAMSRQEIAETAGIAYTDPESRRSRKTLND